MERLILFLLAVGCGVGAWLTSYEEVVTKEFVVTDKSKVEGLYLYHEVEGKSIPYKVEEAAYIKMEIGDTYKETRFSGYFWLFLVLGIIFLLIWGASVGIDLSDLLEVFA